MECPMTAPLPESAQDPQGQTPPRLDQVSQYLSNAGWLLIDQDSRSTAWRPGERYATRDLQVILPVREDVADYAARLDEALRVVGWIEGRTTDEIADDISFGGADSIAVRLRPEAPSGQAPLSLARAAVSALRDYVVGSASALQIRGLVLPPRRPQRAENYADRVRLSTRTGSFVLTLALPLDDIDEHPLNSENSQGVLVPVRPTPFGRRVQARMASTARRAQELAEDVSSGRQRLQAFGSLEGSSPNATELAALAALGGAEREPYDLRFSASPIVQGNAQRLVLSMSPGQQRIMSEAAEFLRTKQPRSGVTVVGLVVRLFRQSKFGPGEVVIQGPDDDTGTERRFRLQITEEDYNEAVRAHQTGLQVTVTGDVEPHGTRLTIKRPRSFAVIPGLDDE